MRGDVEVANGDVPGGRDRAWALIVVIGLTVVVAIALYLSFGPKAA